MSGSQKEQYWRIDDPSRQSIILSARDEKLPQVIYWGPALPDADEETLARASLRDITGGMLDELPDLSICPSSADGFSGQPGLKLRDTSSGSPLEPKFRFENAQITKNELHLQYRDEALSLNYEAHFVLDQQTHILTLWARIDSYAPVTLEWLSAPVLPAFDHCDEMIDFGGRWCGEFQPIRTPWQAGIRERESRVGRSDHSHFPGLLAASIGASYTRGDAYGWHYGWSGGHRMLAEELPDGRRQVQFGHATGSVREPLTRFETAPLFVTYSPTGLNGCATAFQQHLRDKVVTWPQPKQPRPVHYNCWEAIYFDHDITELKDIATRAAALGAERFILDDGWFGRRDDDSAGLGDWFVDPRKYPDGLMPLISHINSLGMGFGLWFEPEMVNPDSALFRAHPDWILGERTQLLGRNQYVLDMSRSEIRDMIFDQISHVLDRYPVDYIKWDHNRVLPYSDAAQIEGLYALFAKLRKTYAHIEIESCASGGGRLDFGIMRYCQRIWLSDSNDALERARIQHQAAAFLPLAVTGSHVGPRHCHTSGRVHDIGFRAWVAAQRHMGFEMDPRELTAFETEVLTNVTTWWKSNREWRARADILRLDVSDPSILAEMQLDPNGERFVIFVTQMESSVQISPRPLRLTALNPHGRYRLSLVNENMLSALSRGDIALKSGPITASGQWLMNKGIALPVSEPQSIWVIEGTRQ